MRWTPEEERIVRAAETIDKAHRQLRIIGVIRSRDAVRKRWYELRRVA